LSCRPFVSGASVQKHDASIDASPHRLFVSGVKGSKAPLGIASALILHEADGG
jgi:tRNA1(Val) A37 N6-methylase TrmN6